MGELYRPSCGSEGYAFIDRWCGSCARDQAFRDDEGDSCPIVAATLVHKVDDPEYPSEWIYGDRGPVCTAWTPLPLTGAGRIDDMRQREMF